MPLNSRIAAARLVLGVLALYGGIGAIAALAFVTFGVRRALAGRPSVSPVARLLLFPAAAALWPVVLRRWLAPPRPR